MKAREVVKDAVLIAAIVVGGAVAIFVMVYSLLGGVFQ